MKVGYSALRSATFSLSAAVSRAQSGAAWGRKVTLQRLGELVEVQSRSCTEMVTLFQLLDAQIASQAISR